MTSLCARNVPSSEALDERSISINILGTLLSVSVDEIEGASILNCDLN